MVCLCVYLTSTFSSFLTLFFPYAFSYIFTSLLIYFLTYPSTFSSIDPFRFHAGGRSKRPNMALVFWGFILCCSMFCYGCMFAFVVFVFVFQY